MTAYQNMQSLPCSVRRILVSKDLIFVIFFSLASSKANMLNLFKAFQSGDGKASGIALS